MKRTLKNIEDHTRMFEYITRNMPNFDQNWKNYSFSWYVLLKVLDSWKGA